MSIPEEAAKYMLRIWDQSDEGVAFVSHLNRRNETWREFPVYGNEPNMTKWMQPYVSDLFFSARRFATPTRTNENATSAKLLYADLDGVYPPSLGVLEPTLWWSTTPNKNWQGVWFTSAPANDDLNRRLTYKVGADRGGWHASKMLRVPMSMNYKREAVQNTELGGSELQFTVHAISGLCPSLAPGAAPGHADNWPDPPADNDHEWLLRLYWPEMSLSARSMLVRMRPTDRSLHIIKLARELFACGFTADTIFMLIWGADFNKYRHRPSTLWNEINKYADERRPR